jgi:glycosyltransferase involved in cell wall biosynthesis
LGAAYRFALGARNLKVIFQNKDDLQKLTRLCALPMAKTALIRGSGVDLAQYLPRAYPGGNPVVIFAGRLLRDKGIPEFIDAARLLKKRGLPARFCLVGSPDTDNPNSCTEHELRGWQSEGVIEYWGHRNDMPNVISQAYCVVLPSYYGEGVPKILLEAAACGRAVVTTDWPGCRDAILPNVTGLCVPVRDNLALANAIARLLEDEELCQSMGREGRKLAEAEFGVSKVVEKHMQIYEQLMAASV